MLCLASSIAYAALVQQAYPLVLATHFLERGSGRMRAPLVTVFADTLNYCFGSVLETMGTSVRDVIYDNLARKGIAPSDISIRFDDVVRFLTESFGGSARVIIYKTLVEIHQQYSMRANFTYQDSLREQLSLLRERVVTDHLLPRRAQHEDPRLAERLVPMIPM